MLKKSTFCISEPVQNGVLMKNTFTGGVIFLPNENEYKLVKWLKYQDALTTPLFLDDIVTNGFLVDADLNEFQNWYRLLFETRNYKAHIFTLHFEPTLQCQLVCHYCFEHGANRGISMKPEIVDKSVDWLRKYLDINTEIDLLRLRFFGGEPLLCKDIIARALAKFSVLCKNRNIDFQVEITTNGEFIDKQTAFLFSRYNWKKLQITLDGPENIHNARRHGRNKRSTFANIMNNIKRLLETDYIQNIDIRMTLDYETKNHLTDLIDILAATEKQERINLSLGFTIQSLSVKMPIMKQEELGTTAISIWRYAKSKGFRIPDEFITGPLCVATAKHSAILQPDGNLQKCFCTSGRPQYNFSSVAIKSKSYTQDARFEQQRIDECITEQCSYLPLCGGGCVYNALVENGDDSGFLKRFCQKTLLDIITRSGFPRGLPRGHCRKV